MAPDALELTLRPALDDLPGDSGVYEAQLRKFDEYLRGKGLETVSSELRLQASGHEIGPYLVVLKGAWSSSLPVLSVGLGAWLKGKYGRTVELEVDGIKVKAGSIREVRALLELAQELRESNQPKKIIP